MDILGPILVLLVILGVMWVYENLGDDIAHYVKTRARAFLRKDEK